MKIKLETSRLIISSISFDDIEKIHELHSLLETDKFNTLGIPKSINETESVMTEWIKRNAETNDSFTLKIELSENKKFIGLISLNLGNPKFRIAEVWYKLHSDF